MTVVVIQQCALQKQRWVYRVALSTLDSGLVYENFLMYTAPLLKLADLSFKFSRRKLIGRHFVPTKILLYHFLAVKDAIPNTR